MLSDAYIAGFFDGEGSIGLYVNGRGSYHLRTQLCQAVSPHSTQIFEELKSRFGGCLNTTKTNTKRLQYSWQLNSNACVFLQRIQPFLIIKREQAEIAIAWNSQRSKPTRDSRGRMQKTPYNPVDSGAAKLLKLLKKHEDIDAVMAAQADLVEVVHTLKQVLCVKG